MDIETDLRNIFSNLEDEVQTWISARFALYFLPAIETDEFSDQQLLVLFLMLNASLLSFIHPHLHKKAENFINEHEIPLMDGVSYGHAAAAGSMFARCKNLVFWNISNAADYEDQKPRLLPNSNYWRDILKGELEIIQSTPVQDLLLKAKQTGELPNWKPVLDGAEKMLISAQKQLIDNFYSRKLGYCAKQLEGWLNGRFDVISMIKCLQMPTNAQSAY